MFEWKFKEKVTALVCVCQYGFTSVSVSFCAWFCLTVGVSTQLPPLTWSLYLSVKALVSSPFKSFRLAVQGWTSTQKQRVMGGGVEKKAAHWRQFVCDLHFLKHRRHWSKTQDVISTEWDLLSLPSLCSLARSGGYGGFNHKHSHCVMPGKIMFSLGLVSHSSALIWLNHSLLITSILYAASFKCFSAEVTDFMGVGMPQNIRHLGI